jgi:CheY-like chemotaxis protein
MATILLIEDDQALIKNLSLALDRHTIVSAATGSEGFAKAKKDRPDLILLDILLPGDIDGIQFLEQLKADEEIEDIPILVLTNVADPEIMSRIIAAGGRDYCIKADWSLDKLVEKVEEKLQ